MNRTRYDLNAALCSDVCVKFEETVKETRLTLADIDKISGKWNKDDKSKVTVLCSEATEWLLHNFTISTPPALHKIHEQMTHFEDRLQPYLAKLTP